LICERSRAVASEQIAEALWPNAGQREALTRVRQYVHQLRSSLEPDRGRSASAYVATRRGGYALADAWIDADEFESRAESGLDALAHGDVGRARDDLSAARDLYRGDFLAEDHFAEWALAERDRLRELASRALRPLVKIELESGRIEAAADRARELIGMEPFDVDVCRSYLRLCLRLGRRTEAVRQYSLLRKRMREFFGEELDFALADLAAAA
jgi:DNA-binding SARP family transcriptional activator